MMESRGPVPFALKSISWEKAWIPVSAGMTKSRAIFSRFPYQWALIHHPSRNLKLSVFTFGNEFDGFIENDPTGCQ
jgi:hypothetical protein